MRVTETHKRAIEKRVTMCLYLSTFPYFFDRFLYVVHNQELKAEERARAIRGGGSRFVLIISSSSSSSSSLASTTKLFDYKSLSIIVIITFLNFSNSIKTTL